MRRDRISSRYRFRARISAPYRDRLCLPRIPADLVLYSDEGELLEFLQTRFGLGTQPGFQADWSVRPGIPHETVQD